MGIERQNIINITTVKGPVLLNLLKKSSIVI